MSAPGFRGGQLPPPPADPIDRLLHELTLGAARRAAELPAPPSGFYWHPDTRLETDERKDEARLITTWQLREVH